MNGTLCLFNETNINIEINDLLKNEWIIEKGKKIYKIKDTLIDDGWKIIIKWKRGKKLYHGQCDSRQKIIKIELNKNIEYPFKESFKVGTYITKRNQHATYWTYKIEIIVFNNPMELIRFIFLHEISHKLDFDRKMNLSYKQTKANRFSIRNMFGVWEHRFYMVYRYFHCSYH